MIRYNRRRLLEKLGLGTQAILMGSLADKLVGRAYGAAPPKQAVFWVVGGGTQAQGPMGTAPPDSSPGNWYGWSRFPATRTFAWPAKLAPLEPVRSRVLIVDGLNHEAVGSGSVHGGQYGILTSAGRLTPGGPSIDQEIARTLGRSTVLPSLLVGLNGGSIKSGSLRIANTFAAGPDRPLQHISKVSLLHETLFGVTGAPASKPMASQSTRPILDNLRIDIGRLSRQLAGEERGLLDDYLKAIEAYESQLRARESLTCDGKPSGATAGNTEVLTQSMIGAATLALRCGVTNVVGVAIGTGFDHEDMPAHTQLLGGAGIFDGHNKQSYGYVKSQFEVQKFHMGLVAEMSQTLGPNTVIAYMSDSGSGNADSHHSLSTRFPVIVVGDAGGALRTGQYIRYGKNERTATDLFVSIAQAVGAPLERFGTQAGPVGFKGPLAEVLA